MISVKVKRVDKTLPLPVYETAGSVGFDLLAREDVVIKPQEIKLIPANLIVKVPEGYMLALLSRSSTPKKKRLLKPHSIGVIDQDYCGENDELQIQVYNFGEHETKVEKGEKIAQAVFIRIDKFSLQEIEQMDSTSRGGFGSTDNK